MNMMVTLLLFLLPEVIANILFIGLKEEVDKLKKKLNKLKSEEVDVDQKLKTANEKISGIKATMHQWNVKVE